MKKKLIDLYRQANRKGIVLFSDFLNLNELNIYHQNEKFFETKTEVSGGVPFAERQIVAFIPDALYYEWQFPIAYLEIVPSYPKFAEKLGHRDILGSMIPSFSSNFCCCPNASADTGDSFRFYDESWC